MENNVSAQSQPLKHSRAGIVSFVIMLMVFCLSFPDVSSKTSNILLALNVFAFVLAIVALFQKGTKKSFAIASLVICGILLLWFIGILIFGLWFLSQGGGI